ncbi:MAG: hypothetical protein KatS3mg043_1928 [Rhodothermaceae bacterium]|nr:MAG: hypothetical protein KatS3mg043_1928 [Rhodothermaceae bacterium]
MPTLHNVFSTLRGLHRRLLRREEDARLRRIVDTLRETTAFRALARRDLWALAEAVHPRHYHPDEYFYYENDPGLGLYVVQRGRVRLLVEDGDGGLQEVRQVGEHELFGESALFGTAELRRTETAQAVTETDVLGFFSPDLKTLHTAQSPGCRRRHGRAGTTPGPAAGGPAAPALRARRQGGHDAPVSRNRCLRGRVAPVHRPALSLLRLPRSVS